MYDQIREDILFIILYSVVTTMAMIASCYLLFRQGKNAEILICLVLKSAEILKGKDL
jgi:hypothetical protein